jgi:hypothetical protein
VAADLGRVLAGSAPLGRAGNGNAGYLAARATDGFCERLGRAERGSLQMGCQRPHQGKWPIRRPEFRRKAWSLVIRRNGVFDAAHALGYKPGILGSVWAPAIHSARSARLMQTRPSPAPSVR